MLLFEDLPEIVYTEEHWAMLRRKRILAIRIMDALAHCGILNTITHGSVARGDVRKDSDVDIVVLEYRALGLIEECIYAQGFHIYSRRLVQATPIHTPKIYLYLDPQEELVITVPLAEMSHIEKEFYRFSGMITRDELEKGKRVAGVNKKLILIIPTEKGHKEMPVIGNEGLVAKILGVSIDVVLDRVKALTKRRTIGHTGLFINREIPPTISIEEFIKRLCIENKVFRRRVSPYGFC